MNYYIDLISLNFDSKHTRNSFKKYDKTACCPLSGIQNKWRGIKEMEI